MVGKSENVLTKKNYGGLAFIPMLAFLVPYLGCGLFFYFRGESSPFSFVPREAALMFGIAAALLMGSGKFEQKTESFMRHAASPTLIQQCLIFLMAGMFSSVSKAMGGVDAVVNAGMSILPERFIVPGLFLISCLISISMGTSFGTISAVGPIAVGFVEAGGYDMTLVLCAVLGGAMFGDNLSFISDTTIAATQGAGCEMKDKFRMNFAIAAPAAIFATVMYAIFGVGNTVAGTSSEIEIIKILPYLAVLVMAFCGLNVIYVLGLGLVFSATVGFATGGMNFFDMCTNMSSGISGMYTICLMAFTLKGIVGRVQDMGGIDWLLSRATSNIKTRKGAQYFMAVMISLVNISIGNNCITIIISCEMLKPLAKKFTIAPNRFASILDIFACIMPGLSPIGMNVLAIMAFGGLTNPFSMMKYAFYLYALGIIMLLTIHFDLMKTKEEIEGQEFYPELDAQ